MSKNLKELKKIFNDSGGDYKIKQYVILMLEEHEKQVNELTKRVKRLEQAQNYQPLEYSKINETGGVNNIKIGGTCDD